MHCNISLGIVVVLLVNTRGSLPFETTRRWIIVVVLLIRKILSHILIGLADVPELF